MEKKHTQASIVKCGIVCAHAIGLEGFMRYMKNIEKSMHSFIHYNTEGKNPRKVKGKNSQWVVFTHVMRKLCLF